MKTHSPQDEAERGEAIRAWVCICLMLGGAGVFAWIFVRTLSRD